jgi:hypothetical protein
MYGTKDNPNRIMTAPRMYKEGIFDLKDDMTTSNPQYKRIFGNDVYGFETAK